MNTLPHEGIYICSEKNITYVNVDNKTLLSTHHKCKYWTKYRKLHGGDKVVPERMSPTTVVVP